MAGSFAHLLRLGNAAAKRAEETEDEKAKKAKAKKAEEDEEKEETEQRDEEEDDSGKKADIPAKDGDGEDEGEEGDEGNDDAKKSKKAKGKKAVDGDEQDEEDEADMKAKSARGRERARCAAIFNGPAAAHNLVGACHIAFETSLPRNQAIAVLKAMGPAQAHAQPAPRRDALRDRMPKEPPANPGSDAAQKPQGGLAARIVEAGRKRRGEI